MIKVEDLRIGNKVHFNGKHKEVGTVTAIAKENFGDYERVFLNGRLDSYYLPKNLKGIEITGQILLDAGFEEVEWAGGCFEKKGFFIDMDDFECGYKSNWFDSKVQYVHELQNIYFSIFKEELEFKL